MQNFSGGFNGDNLKNISSEEISTETPKQNFINPQELDSDNEEISYVMKQMETLRIKHPDSFQMVLLHNKQILDMIQNNEIKGREEIKKLDIIFKEVESLDIDYLFWSSHKCIKIAALNFKNLDVLHYFIIKKGYRLRNRNIYHNFINEYIKSLKDIDFINCDQGEMIRYVTILQMLLNNGDCDVNDNFYDPVKNTPLHYAIAYKQLQFVIVLIKFKYTNLSKINENGDTPLDFAVENLYNGIDVSLNKEFCKLLITFGAKTNSMNRQYKEMFEDNVDYNNISDNNEINTEKKNDKKNIVSSNVQSNSNNNDEKIHIVSKNKENKSENIKKDLNNNDKDNDLEKEIGISCMQTFSF